MSSLPYLQPERDFYYNAGILMLIIGKLARTKRGKAVLTLDKIQTFYFLVTRPVFLNKVLSKAGKKQFLIDQTDYFTVDTIALNVDELFNRDKVTELIKALSVKGYIQASFNEKDGFLFELNESGLSVLEELSDGYYRKIKDFVDSLAKLQSENSSKISTYINSILKQGEA
ncbi:hypothetical protein L1077_19890 [Pseudoalteromonas luteoviolacea]|uniref:ABC-three component system middle component 4 n=1 Tax=Pseudoalteromonas luteoviolacea TaxID=43657 RepID=UPI001F38084C|nr:ABC-three component system middle component 4 [Pseudoalteromonas luteoviolacea]MCF6441701.1 hypothetical protein [Pseudoalteromonas luteoviolacea]